MAAIGRLLAGYWQLLAESCQKLPIDAAVTRLITDFGSFWQLLAAFGSYWPMKQGYRGAKILNFELEILYSGI
jgi:hypothetical protein